MPPADPFLSRLVHMLAPLGPVEPRAMFGGHGLYLEGIFFAIVRKGRVYFRIDDETADAFASGGGLPFRYRRNGQRVTMSYRAPPPASLRRGETLLPWARHGIEAARRRPRRPSSPRRQEIR